MKTEKLLLAGSGRMYVTRLPAAGRFLRGKTVVKLGNAAAFNTCWRPGFRSCFFVFSFTERQAGQYKSRCCCWNVFHTVNFNMAILSHKCPLTDNINQPHVYVKSVN